MCKGVPMAVHLMNGELCWSYVYTCMSVHLVYAPGPVCMHVCVLGPFL